MVILGIGLYFVFGYVMYRLTCVINPPSTGHGIGLTKEYTTWNGSSLSFVFGVCLLIWPIVLSVEIIRFNKFMIHRVLQNQAKKSVTKPVPTVKPKDLFLEEGVREMEKCLTENTE